MAATREAIIFLQFYHRGWNDAPLFQERLIEKYSGIVRDETSGCPTRVQNLLAKIGVHFLWKIIMTDPRNVAHDKKVQQEKKHHNEEIASGADKTPQPGKKTHMEHHASDVAKVPTRLLPCRPMRSLLNNSIAGV